MSYTIRKTDKCPADKPWGLIREDGSVKSCHVDGRIAHIASEIIMRAEANKKSGTRDGNNQT